MFRFAFVLLLVFSSISSCSSLGNNGADILPSETVSTSIHAKNSGNAVGSTSGYGSPVTGGDVYFAKFKHAMEPVPDMLSPGLLTVEKGCAVIRIGSRSDSKVFTAVFPGTVSIKHKGGHPFSASFFKKVVPFDVSANIPGGPIGSDNGHFLSEKLPLFCPTKLFGLGG